MRNFEKLIKYKEFIVDQCAKCEGNGYLLDESKCICMKVFCFISKLVLSEIPNEYWNLLLSDLEVPEKVLKIINIYLENINNAVDKHKCIMFTGTNGVGKTAIMCEIGKEAIVKNYKVCYITFEDLIDSFYPKKSDKEVDENKEFLNRIKKADFILLDEFGKAPLKENSLFIPQKLENFIKKVVNEKVMVATTNFNKEQLKNMFGESCIDALYRQTYFLKIDGGDYTEKRHNEWVNDLTTEYNYFHKNILYYAERIK